MAAIVWTIEADFDKDDSYSTDLTQYVAQPVGSLGFSRGLGKDGVYHTSRLSLGLNNSTGIFTPDNSAGALYGMLEPEVPIRVTATHSGVEYSIWTGYIKAFDYQWAAGEVATCKIEAEDISAYLSQYFPVNVVSASRTSGAALTAIAADMGLPSTDYDFADGVQTFPYHWVRNVDAMSAFMDVMRSEMGGQVFVDGDGKLIFEGRDSRLGLRQFDRYIQRLGPAAAYRFGEASGTTVYDYSGNANNVTLVNSPARGASISGAFAGGTWDTATDFEASSSQYGTAPDHATLDLGDSFSLVALVKQEGIHTGTLIDKGANGYKLSVAGNQVMLWRSTGNIMVTSTTSIPTSGSWVLIVATKDGADVHLYIDGVDVSGTVTNFTCSNTALALSIGANNTPASYFDGAIARVAVFDDALTAAEVTRLQRARAYGAWGDDTTIFPRAIEYELDDQDLITTASVQAQIVLDSEPSQIVFGFSRNGDTEGGRTADSILVAAGGQYGPFETDYARPILSLVAPVAETDYRANSAIDGTGTNLTADLEVTVTDLGAGFSGLIRNTSGTPAYITKFELRGIPLDVAFDRPQFTTTRPIPGNLVDMGATVLLAYADDADVPPKAQDYSHALASRYRWPYPRVTLSFAASTDTRKAAFLALEVGDLVYYKDTGLGVDQSDGNPVASAYLNDWWYVEAIEMGTSVEFAGQGFEVAVTLIPSWLYRNLDAIAYDLFERDDAVGDLGTSLSGHTWADDADFDIATNRARVNDDTLRMPNVDLGALAFDQVVEVDIANISTGDEVGVVFRYVDANNQYRCYLDKGSNEVILEKNVAAAVTEISSPAFTVGTEHSIRVFCQGNRIRVWADRRLMIDTTDTAQNTGTKVGLFARNANATATFDSWYAEAL